MGLLVGLLLVLVFVAPAGVLALLFFWARWLGHRTAAPRYGAWVAYVPLVLAVVATIAGTVGAVVGVLRAMAGDISPADRQRVLASGVAEAFYDGVLIVVLAVVVALWLLFGTWRWHWATKPRPVVEGESPSRLEDVLSRIRHGYIIVKPENIEDARTRTPDLIAQSIEPGCVLWTVPSKKGHVVVIWPEKAQAALGYEWDECIMFGALRVDGDRLVMVEGRSRQSIDLNRVPKM